MTEELFNKEDIIFSYSSEEAEEDGFLFDIDKVKGLNKGLFKYVTTGLFNAYGLDKTKNFIPCLIDLLNQAREIVRKKSNNFKDFDYFFSGKVENINGEKIKIFIEQNETGKFTLLLPSEH